MDRIREIMHLLRNRGREGLALQRFSAKASKEYTKITASILAGKISQEFIIS